MVNLVIQVLDPSPFFFQWDGQWPMHLAKAVRAGYDIRKDHDRVEYRY